LGTGDAAALRALVVEAPTLWWPPAPEVVDVVVDDLVEAPAKEDADGIDLAAPPEDVAERAARDDTDVDEQDASEDLVDPSSTRLRTRFGRAVDDIDEFHDIIAAQDVDYAPSVLEAVFERLHKRFPSSAPLADLAAAAHRRAQTVAPFNVGPLLVALLIVGLFVVAIIGASMITQPIDTPFDGYNNPSQTYPEYTFGQTPTPTPEG